MTYSSVVNIIFSSHIWKYKDIKIKIKGTGKRSFQNKFLNGKSELDFFFS